MAKLPWYLKSDKNNPTKSNIHPLWVAWVRLKLLIKKLSK